MATIISRQHPFAFDKLPIEIITQIASYLPQADLINFSQTSTTYKLVAFEQKLKRINSQMLQIPKKIHDSFETLPLPISPTLGLINRTFAHSSFPQHPLVKNTIKHTVLAELTKRIFLETSSLKQASYQAMALGPDYCEISDLTALTLTITTFLEAKALSILVRYLDNDSRDTIIKAAAQGGNLTALTSLLADSTISQDTRSACLMKASFYGYLSLINPLLLNGPVSQAARAVALNRATMHGRILEVRLCLNTGAVDEITRSRALLRAVEGNHLAITNEILANGSVGESYKIDAILIAASKGYSSILEELLKQGPSIPNKKAAALIAAANYGQLETIKKILSLHPISAADQLQAAKAAFLTKHYKVATHLLPLKPLAQALIVAVAIASTRFFLDKLQKN